MSWSLLKVNRVVKYMQSLELSLLLMFLLYPIVQNKVMLYASEIVMYLCALHIMLFNFLQLVVTA